MKVASVLACLFLVGLLSTSAHADLIGETFDGDFGINFTAGPNPPFGPNFLEQIDGGLAVVGAGTE